MLTILMVFVLGGWFLFVLILALALASAITKYRERQESKPVYRYKERIIIDE